MRTISSLEPLVRMANGMLPLEVYKHLYEIGARSRTGSWIEVGTAHGASAIAVTLGALTSGGNPSLHSIDRMEGRFSSRGRYGDSKTNASIARENLRSAGVDRYVTLFVGDSSDFVSTKDCPNCVELLILDADGRIDRDFLLFLNRMPPGSPIIIDDTDTGIFLNRSAAGELYLDLKHRISSILLKRFVKEGFLEVETTIEATTFCRRQERRVEISDFRLMALECYRELVFSAVEGSPWVEAMEYSPRKDEVECALRWFNAVPDPIKRAVRFGRRILGVKVN